MAGIPVDEALARVMERARPLRARRSFLSLCGGEVLAEEVRAAVDLPPFDNAAMDGYAVRSADVAGGSPERPAALRVTTVLPAGFASTGAVGPGEAVRIMTGAPVPPGADEVVERERAEEAEGIVRIRGARGPGGNIRRAGEDVRAGEVALAKGAVLGPAEIGLLAALGVSNPVTCFGLEVGVLSTGDEIVEHRLAPGPGQIRDANGPALYAAVASARGAACSFGPVPDRVDAIVAPLEGARVQHVLIVSGGIAGTGDRDFMAAAAERLGFREVFRGVRMRPGGPVGFYERPHPLRPGGRPPPEPETREWLHALTEPERQLLFALPGNPGAALVCFEVFVRPALDALQGRRPRAWVSVPAPAARPADRAGKAAFLRARLGREPDGRLLVRELLPEGSGLLTPLCRANALLRYDGAVAAGEPVRALLLREVEVDHG